MPHPAPPRALSHHPHPLVRSWFPPWVMAAVAATVFALVFATQHYLDQRARGITPPIAQLAAMHLIGWYLWLALSPFIVAVVRRSRLDNRRRLRRLGVQAVAAVAFSAIHAALTGIVDREIVAITASLSLPLAGTGLSLGEHILTLFAGDIVVYSAIVAAYHAVTYYARYRSHALQASRLEDRLAQAQLQVLRAQLQPHFLFNALNAVSSLMHRDVEAADTMLAALSDLLRLALHNSGAPEVPLKQELEFVQRYLDVMRVRFGDRLVARVEVDPASLDALVPNLLLQPLVENAVRHGVAQRVGGGRVELRAERRNGVLRLQVADNGPGLPDGWDERRHAGVGLRNTRSRLRQLYGPSYRLVLRNRPEGGLELIVSVPYRPARTSAAEGMDDG
jgi:two-component system LytT family sensor kinase